MKLWIIILCIFLSIVFVGNYFDYQNISYANEQTTTSDESNPIQETSTLILLNGQLTIVPENSNIVVFEINKDNSEAQIETITPDTNGFWNFSKAFNDVGEYTFKFVASSDSTTAYVSIVIDKEGEQYISKIIKNQQDNKFISFDLSTFNVPIGRSNSCNSCHNLHVSQDPDHLRNDIAITSTAKCVLELLSTTSP
jgi:predicted CXXCH cytochrome family protein